MSTESNNQYVAGSCNIGPSEIHRRYQVAILGGIIYLALAVALIVSDGSTSLRFIAFLPAMLASVGFIQARRKFCFAYGLSGVLNFGKAGAVTKVLDPVALAADRAYAFKIIFQSALLASILTAVLFAL
jgi:hypothetical protein